VSAKITAVRWYTVADESDPTLYYCGQCGHVTRHGEGATVVTSDAEYARCHEHRPRDWEPCGVVAGVEVWGPYHPDATGADDWLRASDGRYLAGRRLRSERPRCRVDAVDRGVIAATGRGATLTDALLDLSRILGGRTS
jgi:hypothetical protein